MFTTDIYSAYSIMHNFVPRVGKQSQRNYLNIGLYKIFSLVKKLFEVFVLHLLIKLDQVEYRLISQPQE